MTPDQFLLRARLTKGQHAYAVGASDSNITLYRQQIRALNLVYALANGHSGVNAEGSKLAIIGAGAFGITAAVAAASIGYEVYLYERHQMVLPVQRGCDTRWVNPRFYEWPRVGSETRFAALPLMSWQAGTADQVADQLWRSFDGYYDETGRIKLMTRAEVAVDNSDGRLILKGTVKGFNKGRQSEVVDAVVFAVGFGVEEDYGQKIPSYWHNDDLGQLELRADRQHYFLSGVGDGGLTDLARLRIRRFRHELIFDQLFQQPPEPLLKALRELHDPPPKAPPDWVFEKLQRIRDHRDTRDAFAKIRRRVELRIRADTSVTVNSRKSEFRDALDVQKVSIANALVAFILNDLEAFEYAPGTLRHDADGWSQTHDGVTTTLAPNTTVIVRHGSSATQALTAAGVTWRKRPFPEGAEPIYPAGWWGTHQVRDRGMTRVVGRAVEFVPPAAELLATTFVSTLADVLVQRHLGPVEHAKDGQDPLLFRVTLHRVIRLGDETYFQQLAPYAGRLKPDVDPGAGIGRVFTANAGIGGLAIRAGQPVWFRRPTKKSAFELMERLTRFAELKARPIAPEVNSIFTLPFFSADGKTSFLLFADSSLANLFDRDALQTIRAACSGFVRNIDELLRKQKLSQVAGLNDGHRVTTPHGLDAQEMKEAGLLMERKAFLGYKADLTFTTLTSTELEAMGGVRATGHSDREDDLD